MPARPLIHLGIIDVDRAGAAGAAPTYAIGSPSGEGIQWNPVGPLSSAPLPPERLLLAGLSALALRYVRQAQVQIGDPVLVFGGDPWALLLLQWARLQGASPLVFAGRGPEALGERVSAVGIDAVLWHPTSGDLARVVGTTYRGAGFAVSLDGIASERSMSQALSTLRDGGRYVLAGLDPQPHVSLNAYPDLHRRDLVIVPVVEPATQSEFTDTVLFSLQLVDKGRLTLEGMLGCGWRVETGDPRE